MSDKTTTSVEKTTSSDGNVKISLERYNELKEQAAEKPANYTVVQKTDRQRAVDNQMWGALWAGAGVVFTVIGIIANRVGHSQEKKLN